MSGVEEESDSLGGRELRELQKAVAGLRQEIERRFGTPGEAGRWIGQLRDETRSRVARMDVTRLFEEVRRRLSFLGMAERSAEVDEFGLDAAYLRQARPLLDFLYDRWWRVKEIGMEQIPDNPRVLFVANRSGILPYDGLMIAHAVERRAPDRVRPRFLVADWLVRLPFTQPILPRLGGVRACPENAARLLSSDTPLIVFPEGQKGALKPFRDRYQLQRFGRGGFVSLAIEHSVPIVPVAVVGAEEAHPLLFRPQLPSRLIGAPFPVTPTFPHLGPLGLIPLPSQWVLLFGEPFRFDAEARERAEDPLYINRTRQTIRSTVQHLVDEGLKLRRTVWSAD
ncbi:MAG: lysophospholipid acyltransferase family protein [Myxococcota bacterium]